MPLGAAHCFVAPPQENVCTERMLTPQKLLQGKRNNVQQFGEKIIRKTISLYLRINFE